MLLLYTTFLFQCYRHHRDLHVPTHSVPTRRSSDLRASRRNRKITPTTNTIDSASDSFTSLIDSPMKSLRSNMTSTRSEEHTSELQSLMRNSYAGFRLKKKNKETSLYRLPHDNNNNYQVTQKIHKQRVPTSQH